MGLLCTPPITTPRRVCKFAATTRSGLQPRRVKSAKVISTAFSRLRCLRTMNSRSFASSRRPSRCLALLKPDESPARRDARRAHFQGAEHGADGGNLVDQTAPERQPVAVVVEQLVKVQLVAHHAEQFVGGVTDAGEQCNDTAGRGAASSQRNQR